MLFLLFCSLTHDLSPSPIKITASIYHSLLRVAINSAVPRLHRGTCLTQRKRPLPAWAALFRQPYTSPSRILFGKKKITNKIIKTNKAKLKKKANLERPSPKPQNAWYYTQIRLVVSKGELPALLVMLSVISNSLGARAVTLAAL